MKHFNLPKDHKPYIDKYFLRAKEILVKDELNPMVKVQVFIRRGYCKLYGIDEAIAIIMNYAPNNKLVKINALQEGDHFEPSETLMTIEAPIQEIIDLETMYLGVLSAETTLENDKEAVNLSSVTRRMKKLVELVGDRPISYFGARHWRWDLDAAISQASFDGGAESCSTDKGADVVDKEGIGTIPHSLEAIYDWRNKEGPVFGATMAFHSWMDKAIPRIALVDYSNEEITDSLALARELGDKLYAIRIDTCGENYMQGVMPLFKGGFNNWWISRGVSIQGVYLVRKILNDSGYNEVKIVLSSGFGNSEKVRAFIDAEKKLGIRLFGSLGVGGIFESRVATADIIEVEGKEIHKVGRNPRPNKRLKRVV